MSGYRLRLGDIETTVADAAALTALAKAGRLRPEDQVETTAGWVRADQVPELRGHLGGGGGDPWAAWGDVDNVDAASLYRKMVVKDEPVDLPQDALEPVAEPRPVDDDPATDPGLARPAPRAAPPRPDPALETLVPAVPDPARIRQAALPRFEPPGGEVIDFPRSRKELGRDAAPTLPTRRPPAPPPLVRTGRVVAMVIAGMLLVLGGYAWIQLGAYSRAGVDAPMVPTNKAVTAAPSPLLAVEKELRGALASTPRAVAKDGDLSDALLLELNLQHIDVVNADGHVTKWVGRKLDEPKAAEVRIQYRTGGDRTRELSAIALVVGRYKRVYRMEIPVFEVTEVTARGMTPIDAQKAEDFYQARLNMEGFLASLTAQPGK